MKKHRYLFGLTWLVALFILPLPFLWTLSSGLPSVYASESTAILLGAVAYSWMLLAIYIGTKPKWLDRLIGLPSAYMLHGILSLAAIILAYFHKEGSPSSGWIKLTGDWAFNLFVGLALYSMIFMAGWLTNRIHLLKVLKTFLEKIFKHELSVWLHRLNIVATLLVFVHVQLISYVTAIKPFMIIFYLETFFVFCSYFWFHFKPQSKGVSSQLVENRLLADNIRELVIELPRQNKMNLRAGDYVFISFPDIKSMGEPHPFSLVNNPQANEHLVLAIRGDGDFTRQLSGIPVGSKVKVDGGFGMYQSIIDQNQPKELLIIGGGIGVVPLLSVVESNPQLTTHFFYTVSKNNPFIYENKFNHWEQRHNFTSKRQVGRFSDDFILTHLPDDRDQVVVLLGGPASMGRHWISVFQKAGIPRGHIYYEEFSW